MEPYRVQINYQACHQQGGTLERERELKQRRTEGNEEEEERKRKEIFYFQTEDPYRDGAKCILVESITFYQHFVSYLLWNKKETEWFLNQF